jgi:hypothetical protein
VVAQARIQHSSSSSSFIAGTPPGEERSVATDKDADVVTVCSPPAPTGAAADAGGGGRASAGGAYTPGLLTDTPPDGAPADAGAGGFALRGDGDMGGTRQALVFAMDDADAADADGVDVGAGRHATWPPDAEWAGQAAAGLGAGRRVGDGAAPAADHGVVEANGRAAAAPLPMSLPAELPGAILEHHGACIVRLPPGAVSADFPAPCAAGDDPRAAAGDGSERLRGGQHAGGAQAVGRGAGAQSAGPAHGPAVSGFAAASGASPNGWAHSAVAEPRGDGGGASDDEDMEADEEGREEEEEEDEASGGGRAAGELLRDESIEETLVGSFTKLHVSPPGSPAEAPPAALGAHMCAGPSPPYH